MESGIIRVLVLRKRNIIKKNLIFVYYLYICIFWKKFKCLMLLFEDKEIKLVLINIENNFCLG